MSSSRILIVDDDQAMLMAMAEMLRRQIDGVQVDTSSVARQALAQVLHFEHDAIISDIRMPGMDGLMLLNEIKALTPDTPILLMTADGDRDLVVHALRGGAYDFIEKPIDPDYLAASLHRAMQMSQLRRKVAEQQRALERHAEHLEQTVKEAVAEAQAAQRRLAFLADASTLLASSLDYEETLNRVARLAVLSLADYCVADIVQTDGTLRCVGLAHMNRAQEQLVRDIRQYYHEHENRSYPALAVLESRQPAFYSTVTDEMLVESAIDDSQLQQLRRLHPQSVMILPLITNDRTLGVLTFALTSAGQQFSTVDQSLAEDLTRRAALAVDNARLYEEAQEALHVREQFLSVASHELNTPITAILGYAQLLQRRVQKGGGFTDHDTQTIQTIMKQARRLHQLSLLLLDNSRIETGHLSISHEPVDLRTLLASIVDEIGLTVYRHTIHLRLPEGAMVVEGDALRLQQVFQNLVQNAVKYSPNGGEVVIAAENNEDTIAIKISDQGIGIPASALPHIFDRFYRAKNVGQQRINGMGLGLYVVHEIVTLHNGTIEVTSVEGQGSTFTVHLPLMPGMDSADGVEHESQDE